MRVKKDFLKVYRSGHCPINLQDHKGSKAIKLKYISNGQRKKINRMVFQIPRLEVKCDLLLIYLSYVNRPERYDDRRL